VWLPAVVPWPVWKSLYGLVRTRRLRAYAHAGAASGGHARAPTVRAHLREGAWKAAAARGSVAPVGRPETARSPAGRVGLRPRTGSQPAGGGRNATNHPARWAPGAAASVSPTEKWARLRPRQCNRHSTYGYSLSCCPAHLASVKPALARPGALISYDTSPI